MLKGFNYAELRRKVRKSIKELVVHAFFLLFMNVKEM